MSTRTMNRGFVPYHFSKKSDKGFLTIELMIALTVFMLAMTGVFAVAAGGQTMGLDVGFSGGGIGHALSSIQESTQAASVLAGFEALDNGTNSSGSYNGVQTVHAVSPCEKVLEHSTGWETEYSRSLSVGLATLVPSLDIAEALAGGCDPLPPLGWDNPMSYGSVDIGGTAGTGIAVRSIGGTRYAFLTAAPSAAGKDDFYVYDVEDAQNPTEIASINTGVGLNGIAMGATTAFVIQNDNANQLQVIDVSNPSAPAVIAQASLPNIIYTCSPATAPCLAGRSVAYYDNTIYIGTQYLSFGTPPLGNNELHIFDVSNPATPVWKGSVNVNHNINDIAVDNDYAYLATSNNSGELTVVTVSNPISPSITSTYDASWSTKDAQSIEVVGDVVYLGRDKASAGDYDFLTIDVGTPSAPALLGKLRLVMNGAGAALTGLDVQGDYAFIGTSDTNDEFRVFDVSNPASPAAYGCAPYNYSAKINELVYADQYVFATNQDNDAFRIIYDDPAPGCH